MPVNSRHTPECPGCGEEYITPDDLEKQIKPQIEDAETFLKSARDEMQDACDHISSLKDELSSWEQKRRHALTDVENEQMELTRLRTLKIFREVDREAKARLDKHQRQLPFEVPA